MAQLLKGMVKLTPIGIFDKILGAATGCIKWIFAMSVVVWVNDRLGFNLSSYTKKSDLFSFISNFAPQVYEWLGQFFPFLDYLNQLMEKSISKKNDVFTTIADTKIFFQIKNGLPN